MADIVSRPYRVDPDFTCERCVFGSGEHAYWCPVKVGIGRSKPSGTDTLIEQMDRIYPAGREFVLRRYEHGVDK